MSTSKQLSDRRDRLIDYSDPGTYHLVLETLEDVGVLGRMKGGTMTLNKFGEAFLAVLAMALQHFTCLCVDGMDIRPNEIELVVRITTRRRWLCRLFALYEKARNRWHERRTMTIPLFVGYVKQISARRINALRGVSGGSFWTVRYKAAVLTDPADIERLCTELNARFQRVRYTQKPHAEAESCASLSSAIVSAMTAAFGSLFVDAPPMGETFESPWQGYDTMLLGTAFFLRGSMLRPLPTESADKEVVGEAVCTPGGRTRLPLIWSVGPGRIFLSPPSGR